MTDNYPRALSDLSHWARSNGVTVLEARLRFAQYVVLCGIASAASLRESLVFKGGNALDFVWQPNRSTTDLDFSFDMSTKGFQANPETIREQLERGFRIVSPRYGVVLVVNSVKQQPPGANRTFVTYSARVGYALPDERQLLIRMANSQTSPHMLPIEISINEPIGDATRFQIDERFQQLRICTLEDIVGEKLRSLLQQPIRNRNRRQDVLDTAVMVRTHPELDRVLVTSCLLLKANARDILVSKSAFRGLEIRERARVDYDALASTTRTLFIEFDEAFATVLSLVDELSIPD